MEKWSEEEKGENIGLGCKEEGERDEARREWRIGRRSEGGRGGGEGGG